MPPTRRKRRYGFDTKQLSIRLAGDTYDRLYSLVPSGRHSEFVDRATKAALDQLGARRATRPARPRPAADVPMDAT